MPRLLNVGLYPFIFVQADDQAADENQCKDYDSHGEQTDTKPIKKAVQTR